MSQTAQEIQEQTLQALQPAVQARFFQKLASDWNVIPTSEEDAEALLKAAGILSQAELAEMQKKASSPSPICSLVSGLEKAAAQQFAPAPTPGAYNQQLLGLADSLVASQPGLVDNFAKLAELNTQANAQVG